MNCSENDKLFELVEFDSNWNPIWKINRPRCKKGAMAGYVNSGGYLTVQILGKSYYVHRLVYSMVNSIELNSLGMIDHIDRNKLNNNPLNLRLCNSSENGMNRGVQSNSSSKLKGVSFRKDRNKWLAKITRMGVAYHIGLFETKEQASEAYRNAMAKIHGEFASL